MFENAMSATKISRGRTFESGERVMFRAPDMPRRRQGTVTGVTDAGLLITGVRQAHTSLPVQRVLDPAHVWTLAEHEAYRAPKGTHVATSAHGRILAPEVARARGKQGYQRLGIPEGTVLTHPEVLKTMRNQLERLARTNHDVMEPGFRIEHGSVHNDSPESMDVFSEFQMALINSLRRQTAQAPQEMVDEFRDHLEGRRDNSRIFWTAMKDGTTAALRQVKERKDELQTHDEFNTAAEGEYEAGMHDISAQTATPHHSESDAQRKMERDHAIEHALAALDPRAAELLRRKFGLGDYVRPESLVHIARTMRTTRETIEVEIGKGLSQLAALFKSSI